MGILLNIAISAAATLATILGVYNYVPLDFLDLQHYQPQLFGISTTTIQATDTLRDSRAVINDNFDFLGQYKIHNTTTTVSSITTLSNLTVVGTLDNLIVAPDLGVGTSSPYAVLSVVGGGHFTSTTTIPGVEWHQVPSNSTSSGPRAKRTPALILMVH